MKGETKLEQAVRRTKVEWVKKADGAYRYRVEVDGTEVYELPGPISLQAFFCERYGMTCAGAAMAAMLCLS